MVVTSFIPSLDPRLSKNSRWFSGTAQNLETDRLYYLQTIRHKAERKTFLHRSSATKGAIEPVLRDAELNWVRRVPSLLLFSSKSGFFQEHGQQRGHLYIFSCKHKASYHYPDRSLDASVSSSPSILLCQRFVYLSLTQQNHTFANRCLVFFVNSEFGPNASKIFNRSFLAASSFQYLSRLTNSRTSSIAASVYIV